MYMEAETLSSRTYCESCFACLTAYLAYLCMETHYEKVSAYPDLVNEWSRNMTPISRPVSFKQ